MLVTPPPSPKCHAVRESIRGGVFLRPPSGCRALSRNLALTAEVDPDALISTLKVACNSASRSSKCFIATRLLIPTKHTPSTRKGRGIVQDHPTLTCGQVGHFFYHKLKEVLSLADALPCCVAVRWWAAPPHAGHRKRSGRYDGGARGRIDGTQRRGLPHWPNSRCA
jgi:hypothetical protein